MGKNFKFLTAKLTLLGLANSFYIFNPY